MIGKQSIREQFDAGVSPVIGVILMVAITVILAAVIGTFVLDLGEDLEQDAQAAVTFDEDVGEEVVVQLNNIQSGDEFRVEVDGADAELTSVGETVTLVESDADGDNEIEYDPGETITVIGVLDGNESVLQTYETTDPDE